MQKLLQYFVPFELPKSSKDKSTLQQYQKWEAPSRLVQIAAITFLTALLYFVFSVLDKTWASEQVQALMLKLHLFIIVPMLLTISYLAYRKLYYNFVMAFLALSPVVAMTCHVYIASELENYGPILAEGYLCVFWIFVVSGMSFRYALLSAIVTSTLLIVSGFYIIADTGLYTMHVFWVICSFSFGFLAALIYDRSKKAVFCGQQELHQLAITDELTGAYNRNRLNSVLSNEMMRNRRYQKTFGLLLVDIDHFKNINDTYGHAAGDRVLRKAAQLLSQSIRANDTLVRWGGEEFVVVAIEMNEKSLSDLCEKLRSIIAGENFEIECKVTVSIGATLSRKSDSEDDVLSRADKALYEAKEKGRNYSVCV